MAGMESVWTGVGTKKTIKGALIDLSGTIHVADNAIPGAAEACIKLQERGIRVRFLTNTSKTSSTSLLAQLRRIGFDERAVPNGSVMTSTGAAREMLVKSKMRPLCLVEDDLLEDLKGIDMDDPNCVLVGLAPSKMTYGRLNEAFRLLLRVKDECTGGIHEGLGGNASQSPLVAIHRAKYFRDGDGSLSLGPGGFVTCLEEGAGLKATVVGKPSRSFFQSALSDMGVRADEAVMVGDDIIQDVGGARQAGIGMAILVRTGKYINGDETRVASPDFAPSLVVDSIVEAIDFICNQMC